MRTLSLSLFNATGLPKQAISPILKHVESSSALLITETWLLSPNRYPTPWQQFHTYGQPINSSNHRGSLGIALLVNPISPYTVHHIQHNHPLLAKYTLSFTIAKILVHCLYLSPSLSHSEVSDLLASLPLDVPNTNTTIICGDLNARMGSDTGDSLYNTRGRILQDWIQSHKLITWNARLKYGCPTYMVYQGSSIIDYFLSTTELDSPELIIRNDLSLDSNHKLMTLSFRTPNHISDHLQPKRLLWHLRNLKNPKTVETYKRVFTDSTKHLLPGCTPSFSNRQAATRYIEDFNAQLCQAIYTSLDHACGR